VHAWGKNTPVAACRTQGKVLTEMGLALSPARTRWRWRFAQSPAPPRLCNACWLAGRTAPDRTPCIAWWRAHHLQGRDM